MKSRFLKILALGGVIGFVVLLWPIFIQAETSLAIIFVTLLFAVIGLAAIALFGGKRWMLWAALGVWPGALVVGLLFAALALAAIDTDKGRLRGAGRGCDHHPRCIYRGNRGRNYRRDTRRAAYAPGKFGKL